MGFFIFRVLANLEKLFTIEGEFWTKEIIQMRLGVDIETQELLNKRLEKRNSLAPDFEKIKENNQVDKIEKLDSGIHDLWEQAKEYLIQTFDDFVDILEIIYKYVKDKLPQSILVLQIIILILMSFLIVRMWMK